MQQSVHLEAGGLTIPPQPTTIRALLLDDSSFDRARIRRLSGKADLDVQLDEVCSIAEMDRAVSRSKYDLILIDYQVPIGDGMEALQHILQDPMNRDAAKIMITGNAAVDTAVEAMRGGCHDFLTKDDMNPRLLNAAMVNAMARARQHGQLDLQLDYQRDVIRKSLIAALTDKQVTSSVVSILRGQLLQTMPDRPRGVNVMDPGDLEALLADMSDTDDFVFH